jgi:AraC-like DNA-binding protein
MRHSAAIALIRQTEARTVIELLHERGAPVARLLEAAKLPASLEDDATGFVSARSMLSFVGASSRSQDIPDLGWRAATRAPLERLGAWGQPVARSATLREALSSFCRLYARDVSLVELGLSADANELWLWRRRAIEPAGPDGLLQGEQFMLGAMIQVVRRAVGSDWVPPRIRLESRGPSWVEHAKTLDGAKFECASPVMAIAIPYPVLDLPMRGADNARVGASSALYATAPARDLAGSLRQALTTVVTDQPASIELAAEMANMSPRTLSRRLKDEGTGWREILGRVRLEASQKLLCNSAIPISEIAAHVGYSDPAHFTRSFRRWTGETPRDYRRRRMH